MTVISFVILNYHTSSDTKKCIESIRSIADEETDVSVVIVDNGSTEGELEELQEYISIVNDLKCIILEMKENLGFSKANNIGYKYAKETYHPDYIAISNSDIIILQKDFYKKLRYLYESNNFSVFGPDIYVPRKKLHQSPVLGRDVGNINFVQSEIDKCNSKIRMLEKLKGKGLTKVIIDGRSNIKLINTLKNVIRTVLHKGFTREYEGEYIHGSFIICSRKFIDKYDLCFEPEVFLYGEEDLLLYKCLANNDKVLYSPEIKVLHYSGGTGKTKSDSDIDRQISYWKRELQSKKILAEQINKRNGKNI